MKLPRDLRRIRDAAEPGDLNAIKIGLVGGVCAVGFVAAPKVAAWWLAFAGGQFALLRAFLGL